MGATWKISINATEIATYSETVKALPVSGGPQVEQINGYGADAPLFIDHRNSNLQRRFEITKEWPDNAQSVNWFLLTAATLNGVADVYLTHLDYSGVETAFKISGAKVMLEVEEPIGVTTITRLTVNGGKAALL